MQDITDAIRNTYSHIKAAYATHHDSPLFEYYREDVNEHTIWTYLRRKSLSKISSVNTL